MGEPDFEHEGIPFYGGSESMLEDGLDYGMDADIDSAEDIAALARETRAMASMTGEPLDPELDMALHHIEQGADPEDVLGVLDEQSAAEPESQDP